MPETASGPAPYENDTERGPEIPAPAEAAPATRHAAETEVIDTRPDCPHCEGTGKVLTTHDWLGRALGLFPADDVAAMDGIIAEFYRRLVALDQTGGPSGGPKPLGDQLAPLFPADLTTGDALNSRGNKQRDMLLAALVDFLSKFDPDHPQSDDMGYLGRLADKAGRDHASFKRPDGSERGAELDEYVTVRYVFVGLCRDAFGTAWRPEYERAVVRAFNWLTVRMLAAQDQVVTAAGGQVSYARRTRREVAR